MLRVPGTKAKVIQDIRNLPLAKQAGVFQELSHVVQGRGSVKEENKKKRAQLMMTLK